MKRSENRSDIERQWQKVLKQEEAFLTKRLEKKTLYINQKLEGKVPEGLRGALDSGFVKAFAMIFEKGTGFIEKTYDKEQLEKEYKMRQYAKQLDHKEGSVKVIASQARRSGTGNLLVSGTVGVGMGILGMGLPDIPVFVGMILKSIYEIAVRYGYRYDAEAERRFMLMIIQGALSHGESVKTINEALNGYISMGRWEKPVTVKEEIEHAARGLSEELLYLKFLQGVPLIGAIGGVYDAVYMRQIVQYAELKYRRRYVYDEKLRKRAVNK